MGQKCGLQSKQAAGAGPDRYVGNARFAMFTCQQVPGTTNGNSNNSRRQGRGCWQGEEGEGGKAEVVRLWDSCMSSSPSKQRVRALTGGCTGDARAWTLYVEGTTCVWRGGEGGVWNKFATPCKDPSVVATCCVDVMLNWHVVLFCRFATDR